MSHFKSAQHILIEYYENKDNNLKLILNNYLKSHINIENPKIANIVYNVIRKENILDFLIKKTSNISPDKLEMRTKISLKIGIYLILFSKKTPAYAIVNEIVKTVNKSSKSFTNAILRNVIRKKDNLLNQIKDADLSIKYSISPTLIENITHLSKNIVPILEYFNREPIFHILPNNQKLKINNESKDFLTNYKKISPMNTFETNNFENRLKSKIKKGELYIQNTGSQLISIIASHYVKKRLLDCCAAPGTKSITISNLMPNLKIISNDINFKRINMLRRTDNIYPVASDMINHSFKSDFDFLLIDAPCTSSGTLRKNPDLKNKINKELINKNTKIQFDILSSSIHNFKPDYILYSVCSFIKKETDNILKNFIPNNKNITVIDISDILEKYKFKYKRGDYGYYLLPDDELNNDLFYISLLKISNSI